MLLLSAARDLLRARLCCYAPHTTPCCSRLLSTTASPWPHPEFCCFDVLGVPDTASEEDIKKAFRARAKLLHPDSPEAPKRDPRVAQQQFVLLMGAYQVLRNPTTRKRYLESRKQASTGQQAGAAGAAGGGEEHRCRPSTPRPGPVHDAFQGQSMQLRWGLQGVFDGMHLDAPEDSPQRASSWLRAWSVTKHEIHAALRTAYFGPPLPGAPVGTLPPCFEGEECRVAGTPALLQLVHGRLVLGAVTLHHDTLLTGGPHASMALASGRPLVNHPVLTAPTPNKTAPPRPPRQWPCVVLDLVVDHAVTMTAVLPLQRHAAVRALPPKYQPAALFFRQGQLLCSVVHGRVRAPDGKQLATVVAVTTPLVEHVLLVAGRKRPRTVARCQRAWLPPSVAWLFAPRDNAYDVGGWYFELPEDAAGLPALEVHPHIMVLLAGLRSYERHAPVEAPEAGESKEEGVFSGRPLSRIRQALQQWSSWWGRPSQQL